MSHVAIGFLIATLGIGVLGTASDDIPSLLSFLGGGLIGFGLAHCLYNMGAQ